jgi:hypothetical protein
MPDLMKIIISWRWWALGFGLLSCVVGIILLSFRIKAALRHGNIGSRPDWVNPPYTDFERFILHFPVRPLWFFSVGVALVFIWCIGVFVRKRREERRSKSV